MREPYASLAPRRDGLARPLPVPVPPVCGPGPRVPAVHATAPVPYRRRTARGGCARRRGVAAASQARRIAGPLAVVTRRSLRRGGPAGWRPARERARILPTHAPPRRAALRVSGSPARAGGSSARGTRDRTPRREEPLDGGEVTRVAPRASGASSARRGAGTTTNRTRIVWRVWAARGAVGARGRGVTLTVHHHPVRREPAPRAGPQRQRGERRLGPRQAPVLLEGVMHSWPRRRRGGA
jgi:hypothetical protein